ncbi:hypothetical protein CGCF415_v015121 [Colletotrichum fructicola]|uniref:LCCL domain-containing protein n=2 Tax=Colletotrichum gloeosporioides species complex TaxID=2707338 RepID=L2GB86_COLFN|nr:uncharacterized protein CGMCC3_g17405 [Colletotrichum fructicola]KAF4473707.1 hypothetical protein CGGC5_v017371 [Colletotrichum fructicola Nara gc5]KAE9566442.1 hypothetical protein CGMCC3_g17405 [Colletotrichum fructicola]KAF4417306.1 hypothetical protein CFRS1_v015763 [Colletotrichum fructicola]KAF4881748.1 hypothetical protein CGCFRS4_v015251 [Colletotrichum fructicola]KAF4886530.1 hypothetical protein CGCF415_v015121 [Colletotrichum fructicola]
MAAPTQVTIRDLNGTWRMSKTLSDDLGPSLALQGMPWILRKAVSYATITGKLSQTQDDKGITSIAIQQTASGGIKGEDEKHKLDGAENIHGSLMFGAQHVRSSWLDVKTTNPLSLSGEPLDPYLLQGWLDEEQPGQPGHITVNVINERAGWKADQVWGFSNIDGQRYRIAKFLVSKGEEIAPVRVVYEWVGRE